MNKRFIVLFLVVALMLPVFAGCSNQSTEIKQKDEVVEAEAVDVKKVFVTPEWVKSVITGAQEESNNYLIIEASEGKLNDNSDYSKGHIPGALYLNIKDIENPIYWTLKTPEEIEKVMLDLGITKDTVVILYGSNIPGVGRVASALIWAGVENVKVLDGGLDAWTNAGYELETTVNTPIPATEFGAVVPANPEFILSIDEVQRKLEEDSNFRLVSIRSYEEFIGETSGYSFIAKAGEPKGAVWGKGGSSANNMEDYINEDGTVITIDEMTEMWKGLNFTLDNELSFYCGRSWRATIPFLIMYENGYSNMSIYDGGWYRWQMNLEFPVQVGDPDTDEVIYTIVKELPTDKAAK